MNKNNNLHTFVVLAYQESEYLEECLKSVLNQTKKTNVVIATTTDNEYIRKLASKYNLNVIVGSHTTIGGDFDFARLAVSSKLVTIAHQDDIYEKNYVEEILNKYEDDTQIIFTNYYEIRETKNVYNNLNLKIKKILSFPILIDNHHRFFKRLILRFGNSICCPSVTFVNSNCPHKLFTCDFKANCDWYAWEKLSLMSGRFQYIAKPLMGHRVDESTTTTDIINQGIRTNEDYEMFCKFWPNNIAKFLNKFYKKAEQSNNVK